MLDVQQGPNYRALQRVHRVGRHHRLHAVPAARGRRRVLRHPERRPDGVGRRDRRRPTIIGGQIRTVVTGDFKVGTLKANGSAIVETNGATTTLFVDADLVDAGFAARLEGAVIITDGIAETIHLDATVNGTVNWATSP